LIYAALRSPREAVKANVDAYLDYQSDHAVAFAATAVVVGFIGYFGKPA